MKRLLLCGLLLMNGWAGACSIPSPDEDRQRRVQEDRATQALAASKAKHQQACKNVVAIECTVYNAAPYQVVQWMKPSDSNWQKTGIYWQNVNERYGRLTTIKALGGGSIIKTIDRLTAWEKLQNRLYEMKNPLLPWQSCRSMGLNDSAYNISDCRWDNEPDSRNMSFKITASTDESLPVGVYEWRDRATCGYSLEGP